MCHHEEHARVGLSSAALTQALEAAESLCRQANEQLSPSRKRVLQMLLQADGPMKAYDLIATFGANGKPANPPTVYRALEFLGRIGLAHRLESLNAFVACRLGGSEHRAAFLICDCCGSTEEFEPEVMARAAAAAAVEAGYAVRTITLEAHGRCAACRA